MPVQQQQAIPQMQQPQMPQMQQPQMQQQMYGGQQVMQGAVQNQAFGFPQQHIIMSEGSGGKRVVPWIGVGLIILGLVLPFIALGPFSVSGFEIMGTVAEIMDNFSGGDSGGDDLEGSDDADLGFTGIMMVVSGIMFGISPFVYLLSAIISGILLLMKKSPKLMGILHVSYFGVLMVCAFLGTIDAGEFGSFSLIDLLGIGFYMSSLGAALFFVNK